MKSSVRALFLMAGNLLALGTASAGGLVQSSLISGGMNAVNHHAGTKRAGAALGTMGDSFSWLALTPEPISLMLLGTGMIALGLIRRKRTARTIENSVVPKASRA